MMPAELAATASVWPPERIRERVEAVRVAPSTARFTDLIRLAGLDPAEDMRFFDWSRLDFSDCDLTGFDFTGANLSDCRFDRARIAGARFDQAQVDRRALQQAMDWPEHLARWRPAERRLPSGAHLPDLAVFGDAPFAPEMVALPAGEFLMGSPAGEVHRERDEVPQHQVTIGYRLALGRFPVTFAEWDACVTAGGCKRYRPSDQGWGRGKRPVINVSWTDAQAYVGWLSRRTGKRYRLPTEAEWEYAARAGSISRCAFGGDITPKDANYADSKLDGTSEVGAYPANAWGVYDMHGNVREWVQDVWHDSYEGAPVDGSAWMDGGRRNSSRLCVNRGGSWFDDWRKLRSANRYSSVPVLRVDYLGFRVARTLD